MSSPVSSNTTNTFFDEEFENLAKTMKEEAQARLEKISEQAKIAMKEQIDANAKSGTPYITEPCKTSVGLTSTQPIASTVNKSIESSVDPVIESCLKKVGHKFVDTCVDTTAKKVIDQVVDKSVDSTKSYSSTVYDYIQSKFY